jgi:hypothetical protein
MATDFNPFENMPWMVDTVNVPVPVVDPADLKIVWELQQKVREEHPGEQIAISFEHHLKNANPCAIWYRLSMLGILSSLSTLSGMPMEKLPWMQSGKPDEFMFKALASLPMNGTPKFAIDGLLQLIEKEYGTRPTLPTD